MGRGVCPRSSALDALEGAFELLDELADAVDVRTRASLIRRIRAYAEEARDALRGRGE